MAEDEKKGAPLWMCTFSDMMSLLLCFFVLLFALSTIEKKKWVQASGALQGAFGGKIADFDRNLPPNSIQQDLSKKPPPERKRYFARDQIVARLMQKTRTWKLDDKQIEIIGTEKGINFVLLGDTLFDGQSARIRPEARGFLREVGTDLIELPSTPIRIVGHTDDQPPDKTEFASNWRLSMARARQVMRFYTDEFDIPEGRFRYEGAADTHPRAKAKPAADGSTQYYAYDDPLEAPMNRRIEIILLQTDETKKYGWYAEFKANQSREIQEEIQRAAEPL